MMTTDWTNENTSVTLYFKDKAENTIFFLLSTNVMKRPKPTMRYSVSEDFLIPFLEYGSQP